MADRTRYYANRSFHYLVWRYSVPNIERIVYTKEENARRCRKSKSFNFLLIPKMYRFLSYLFLSQITYDSINNIRTVVSLMKEQYFVQKYYDEILVNEK